MSKAEVLADIRRSIQEASGRIPTKVRLSPSVYDHVIDQDDPQENLWGVSYRRDESLEEGWVINTQGEKQ